MSGFDPARAEKFREVRVPIQRVDEHGRVTAHGTARQRGVTLDDYRTDAGIPIKEGPGDSIVVQVLNVSAEDRQRYLELVVDLQMMAKNVPGGQLRGVLDLAAKVLAEVVHGVG